MKKLFLFIAVLFGVAPLFGINGLESNQLAQRAKLVGFDGSMYSAGDKLLSFDGDGNWMAQTMRSFTMSITNATSENKEVTIFPAYMWNPERKWDYLTGVDFKASTSTDTLVINADYNDSKKELTVKQDILGGAILRSNVLTSTSVTDNSLIINDGVIFTANDGKEVKCEGNPSLIRNLITYLINHPSWLQSIKMRSTNPSQLQQTMKFREINPFNEDRNFIIPLTQFTTNKDQQNNLIDIPVGTTIGDTVELKLNVVKESTVDLTFFFGASVNTSQYLTKAAKEAYESQPAKRLV